ncbi:dihydrodipicolinate synthetase [Opitutaceae bacterium TAV5]|nr:dihydrodipicolinate synthetase [Opitutaceae bacterium TAV5]
MNLIAAPFTPLAPDGSLNLSVIAPYAARLRKDGVAGVFICGTTGEGLSLTNAERKQVAEAWRAAIAGDTQTGKKLTLIVHVGHTSIADARDLAAHAEKIGADGIAAIGPVYFAPSSDAALIETNRRIAAAAPATPFYYYHMPSMSRASAPVSRWIAQMAAAVPTFRGVKFTYEDLDDYASALAWARARTKETGNEHEVFFGRDEKLLAALKLGATGAVGSTYNFAAPLYLAIARAHAAGDLAEAERLQAFCTQAIDIIVRHGGLPAIKATLALAGIDCGPMRVPLAMPDKPAVAALEKELGEIGYFEAIRRP